MAKNQINRKAAKNSLYHIVVADSRSPRDEDILKDRNTIRELTRNHQID